MVIKLSNKAFPSWLCRKAAKSFRGFSRCSIFGVCSFFLFEHFSFVVFFHCGFEVCIRLCDISMESNRNHGMKKSSENCAFYRWNGCAATKFILIIFPWKQKSKIKFKCRISLIVFRFSIPFDDDNDFSTNQINVPEHWFFFYFHQQTEFRASKWWQK